MAVASEHAANSEKLADVGAVVASTLDREAILQKVTDIATELTRAEFGASSTTSPIRRLVMRSCCTRWPECRVKRSRTSPTLAWRRCSRQPSMVNRCGWMMSPRMRAMHGTRRTGMPPRPLPVRSYLAVPVKGLAGDVLGGLLSVTRTSACLRTARASRARGVRVGLRRARKRTAVRGSAGPSISITLCVAGMESPTIVSRGGASGRCPASPDRRSSEFGTRHQRFAVVSTCRCFGGRCTPGRIAARRCHGILWVVAEREPLPRSESRVRSPQRRAFGACALNPSPKNGTPQPRTSPSWRSRRPLPPTVSR
jgi:hypothetical protein